MQPFVALRIPISSRNKVVFPAPFGPSNPLIWPAGRDHETSTSAFFSPKDFETEAISTKGAVSEVTKVDGLCAAGFSPEAGRGQEQRKARWEMKSA